PLDFGCFSYADVPLFDVAHALLRAVPALMPALVVVPPSVQTSVDAARTRACRHIELDRESTLRVRCHDGSEAEIPFTLTMLCGFGLQRAKPESFTAYRLYS